MRINNYRWLILAATALLMTVANIQSQDGRKDNQVADSKKIKSVFLKTVADTIIRSRMEFTLTNTDSEYTLAYSCRGLCDFGCTKAEKVVDRSIAEEFIENVAALEDHGERATCCHVKWTEINLNYSDGSGRKIIRADRSGTLGAKFFNIACASLEREPKVSDSAATSHLRPEHKVVVEEWLAKKPNLRVATVEDNTNKEGLAGTREQNGKSYHPYYAVGDFNGDRKEDFAIALVNPQKKKERFAVAIFNGPVGKDYLPAFFEEGWDLSDGGLFEGEGGVMVGPFESDNCVILSPRGKKYVIKDCLEE